MHVSELFDESILQDHIDNGLVSAMTSPSITTPPRLSIHVPGMM